MSTLTHGSRSRTWPQRSNRVKVPDGIAQPLDGLAEDWLIELQAANRSPYTQRLYIGTIADLARFLVDRGMPTDPLAITGEHLREYLRDMLVRGLAPKTVQARHSYLSAFFGWLVEEDEIKDSPMRRIKPPKLDETPPKMVTDEQFAAMLATCRGTGWDDKRDAAILRLLEASGLRRAELAAIRVGDLDLTARTVAVMGKGRQGRVVRFDQETAVALSRYRRERGKGRYHDLPEFFLARTGAMSPNAVGEVVYKRARLAGLVDDTGRELVHPHMFRHRFADRWKAAGGSEEGLMALGGWRSRDVMARYGRLNQSSRALEEYDRVRG